MNKSKFVFFILMAITSLQFGCGTVVKDALTTTTTASSTSSTTTSTTSSTTTTQGEPLAAQDIAALGSLTHSMEIIFADYGGGTPYHAPSFAKAELDYDNAWDIFVPLSEENKLGAAVDYLLDFALSDPSQGITPKDLGRFNYTKSGMINVILQKLYEDYGFSLSDSQVRDMAILFFNTSYLPQNQDEPSINDIAENHQLFMTIVNRHLNQYKQVQSTIAKSVFPEEGSQRNILAEFGVAVRPNGVMDSNGKTLEESFGSQTDTIFQEYTEKVYDYLSVLKPNEFTFALSEIFLRGGFGGSSLSGSFQVGLDYSEFIEYFNNFYLDPRLTVECEEECFASIFFHEYTHAAAQNVDIAGILTKTLHIDTWVDPLNAIYFMSDYTPEGTIWGNPSYGGHKETGAMYSQVVQENTLVALEIALQRAQAGNRVPLAMVLLQLGVLSRSQDEVNLYTLRTVFQGDEENVDLHVISESKAAFIAHRIPAEIQAALYIEFGYTVEELLDSGLFQFNIYETTLEELTDGNYN